MRCKFEDALVEMVRGRLEGLGPVAVASDRVEQRPGLTKLDIEQPLS